MKTDLYEYVEARMKRDDKFKLLDHWDLNYMVEFTMEMMMDVMSFQNVHDMVREEIGDDY